MKNKLGMAAVLTAMWLAMAGIAVAAQLGPTGWNGNNLASFLGTTTFPGSETVITSLDFQGEWMYTAIGRESGNRNEVEEKLANNSVGIGSANYGLTFTTANYSNWGSWNSVNFNGNNLFFEDSNGPYDVPLDAFTGTSDPGFKVFRLTENSQVLSYLSNRISLLAGDFIIGFNDNSLADTDSDYDDMIIAMRAVSVPEPATLILLGAGLVGLGLSRKRMK